MSEGALTLPAPQTSRRRADATEVSLFPVVPALGPSYHLGTQHPALLVLRGQERQLGRVGVGSVRGEERRVVFQAQRHLVSPGEGASAL